MEQGTKIILMAVFILLIAIVSFNFTGMTGEATSEEKGTIQIVSPADGQVHRKDVIEVMVYPTKDGVDNRYLYIYSAGSGVRMGGEKYEICGRFTNTCYEPSSVTLNTLGTDNQKAWPEGLYIIRVTNHKTGENIEATFRLVD